MVEASTLEVRNPQKESQRGEKESQLDSVVSREEK